MDRKSSHKILLFTGQKQAKSTLIWFVILVLALAPMFPVSNFVGHSHWEQVRWIPFQGFSWSKNMLKDICKLPLDRDSHKENFLAQSSP